LTGECRMRGGISRLEPPGPPMGRNVFAVIGVELDSDSAMAGAAKAAMAAQVTSDVERPNQVLRIEAAFRLEATAALSMLGNERRIKSGYDCT